MYQMKQRNDKTMFKYVWSHNGRIYARTEAEAEMKPLPKATIVNKVTDLIKHGWSKEEIKNLIKNKRI